MCPIVFLLCDVSSQDIQFMIHTHSVNICTTWEKTQFFIIATI